MPRPPASPSDIAARVRLACWRRRWPLAICAILLAARLLAPALTPPPPGVDTVVLARSVTVGQTLASADLAVVPMPDGARPASALDVTDEAVGRVAAFSAPAGLALVPELLVGPELTAGGPPGTVVVPVMLADPAVANLLAPGARIDVMAATGTTSTGEILPAQRLAADALVVAALTDQGAALVAAESSSVLLVAVDPGEAALISGAGAWTELSAILVA